MQARRLIRTDVRKIEVEEYDPGPVPPDGILVQNDFTAISVGTEIFSWTQGYEPGRESHYPRGTGYCSAGTVLEVGSEITDVVVGDRIAGQGNHASHAVITRLYRKVPMAVPSKTAVYMVISAIAMHGHRVGRPELGEAVVVMGLGIVGQIAATLAVLAGGLPVIGIDLDEFRIGKALARGGIVCLNPTQVDDLPASVRGLSYEDGANLIIEATGKPAVYPTAVKLACTGGRLVALGSPRGTVEMNFLADVHLREVSILGAIQPKTPEQDHIYYRWTKNRDRDLVLRLMAEGRLPIEDLITHTARPEACQDIFTMLADDPVDALGVVFDWT